MTDKLPRGVSVRIEPVQPLAGGPYRQGQPEPGRLILEHRWGDPELLPGPGGGVAMLVCMVLAVAIFWLEPDLNRFERAMHWFFFLTPIVMAYGSIALRWNTTTYTLDGRRLTVRHGPIPVFGNRAIAKSDIESIAYRYIDNPHDDWSGGTIVVFARLRSGKERELVTRGGDYEQYQFVAEQLSAHLNRMRDGA